MTAYATVAQYKARNQSADSADDLVAEVLLSTSRHLDARLGWPPGGLAPMPAQTVVFWPRRPSRTLRCRDAEGRLWPWRTIETIDADYTGTGAPDHRWTFDDEAWIVGQPQGGDRPWRTLRMLEAHRRAAESVWPSDPGTVTITGEPGHHAIPPDVSELTIHVARETLDSHLGGAAAAYAALDAAAPAGPDRVAMLWRRVEREHSAGKLSRYGLTASGAAARRW